MRVNSSINLNAFDIAIGRVIVVIQIIIEG